jgi:glyoxylase I family protein
MIKQLAHINIGAFDLASSENFYCNVLDMTKTFEFIKNGELYGFYAGFGNNTFIEVFIETRSIEDRPTMMRHLCLEVEDIDTAIANIRAKGWAVTNKKFGGDNSWQCWITDPSGVPIELMQYTKESSQFTGQPCIVDW